MNNFEALTEDHQNFIDDKSPRKIIIGSVAAGKTVACCMTLKLISAGVWNPVFINLAEYHKLKYRLPCLRQYIDMDFPEQDSGHGAFIDGLSADNFHQLEETVGSRLVAVTKGNYSLLTHMSLLQDMGFSVHVLPPMTAETSQHLPEGYIDNWLRHHDKSKHYLMTGALDGAT